MRMFPPHLVWWQCHLPPLSRRDNISRNDQGNSATICNADRLVIAKDQVLIMNNIVTKQPTEKSQLHAFGCQTRRRRMKDHVLQRNLFVVLSSLEMAAQARLLAIMYLSIILSLRCLAGNAHKLASYIGERDRWGVHLTF